MKKVFIISATVITSLLLLFVGLRFSGVLKPSLGDDAPAMEELAKCYHGIVGDSDSVFTVESQEGIQISGRMSFVFAQKDSSHGTYEGTYKDGSMKVAYTFWSEGIESIGDYQFIKDGKNFRGSGYVYQPAKDCEKFLTY